MRIRERIIAVHRAWRYRLRAEREEISFLLSRDLDGQTVVDIGANRGVYSYWMHKKVGPQGKVIAFEPQAELCCYLNDLKNAFRLTQLTIVNAGLSSRPGEQQLVRPKHHWAGASLEIHPSPDTDCLQVRLTTLDDYFLDSAMRPLRFIKCDVEKHEYDVFQGGRHVLQADRPDLLFESFDSEVQEGSLFSYLNELGYEGFFFVRGRLTPVSQYEKLRGTIPKPYFNYVFLNRDRPVA